MHPLQTLQVHQLEILPPLLQQLTVRPVLHDPALIEHVDHIRFLDRAQPMRHRDRSSSPRGRIEGRLHDLLGFRVQRRSGFVEEEDLRIAEERPGDCDPLFLPAGEHAALGADDGGEAVTVVEAALAGMLQVKRFRDGRDLRQRHDEIIDIGVFAGLHDFFLRHIFAVGAQEDILPY
jgi:hypothetical protein